MTAKTPREPVPPALYSRGLFIVDEDAAASGMVAVGCRPRTKSVRQRVVVNRPRHVGCSVGDPPFIASGGRWVGFKEEYKYGSRRPKQGRQAYSMAKRQSLVL